MKQTNYVKFITGALQEHDYLLGKELNIRLQKRFHISSDNARKIIERTADNGDIRRSQITFGNRQFAYLHPGKQFTLDMVLRITEKNRPALNRLILMLQYCKGILSYHEAMKVCATPFDAAKTKSDSIMKLVNELESLEFAVRFTNSNNANFIIYPSMLEQAEQRTKSETNRMGVDTAFIPDVLRALRKYNIIDNDKILYRNKTIPTGSIIQNNYVWDAIAYTKTTGINDARASQASTHDKQTMVALDIFVSRDYLDADLQGFIARIQGMQSAVKTGKRKVLPIIVYSTIGSKLLFNTIHKLGFLCFDLNSIYGSRFFEIMKTMIDLKRPNILTILPVEEMVGETLRLMRDSGQEDNLSNIKGDLFESLMYPLLALLFPNTTIETGVKLKVEENGIKEEYEYDYIITSAQYREITIIELKGYASSKFISLGDQDQKNSLQWFFARTLPFAKRQKKDTGYSITGSYITTSKFMEDGIEFLDRMNKGRLKPRSLDAWYDGKKLMQLFEEHKMKKAKDIVKRYYHKPEQEPQEEIKIQVAEKTSHDDMDFLNEIF